ncbi:hypothetical protein ACS0TY_006917 [Phlomoides rotata]
MEQSDFDSITTRVRHLRENIAELHRNYDQLTLNVKQTLERPLLKIGSPSVTQKERVQQAEPQQAFQVPEPGKVNSSYTSYFSKEKVHQAEPPQGFQVLGSGKANSVDTSSSSKLEETKHQASKPDVSGQPSTFGVKEGEIILRPQKSPNGLILTLQVLNHAGSLTIHRRTYSKEWNSDQNTLSHMCLESIHGFGHSKERTPMMFADVVESWHKNPHLKRGDELEINFITVASEDTTNAIQYLSFHFMKLQRSDKKAFTYIKEQRTKPELMVNLMDDEISTRRAWGVWVCLTEMDKENGKMSHQNLEPFTKSIGYPAEGRPPPCEDCPLHQVDTSWPKEDKD